MIVYKQNRTDCKYIGPQSGWNDKELGSGRVRVAYLKVNFGLGPGKILKFRPVQISILPTYLLATYRI
jgi:hypothetical protein